MCKYDELRQKTEGQLHRLIDHELDLGIREAREAVRSAAWRSAQPHFLDAYRASARASRLMQLVEGVSAEDRMRWERRIAQLRDMLDRNRTPAPAGVQCEMSLRANAT